MLRSPIEELQASHPDLAVRLQTIAHQLHEIGSVSSPPRTFPFDSFSQSPAVKEG